MSDITDLPPLSAPAPPTRPLPPGSWDTHFHIFPPGFPLSPTPVFVPPRFANSVVDRYHSALGITHTVLAHSFAFGTDQSSMYEYLDAGVGSDVDSVFVSSSSPRSRRGIGILGSATTEDIREMHARGVRGVRAELGGGTGDATSRCMSLRALCLRLHEAGVRWSVCIQDPDPGFYDVLASDIVHFPSTQYIMIDHLAFLPGPWSRPSPRLVQPVPADLPGLAPILALLRSVHPVYMKLSAPYRITSEYDTLEPFIRELASAGAQGKLVWGSDWPHTPLTADMVRLRAQGKGSEVIELRDEDTTRWLDLLRTWLGEETFVQMMVDNPSRLYA